MRLSPEQTSTRITASHERQNNNNKNDQENPVHFRTVSMGDGPAQGNINFYGRPTDSVSCWGDAPKRSTRLIDIISELDYDGQSTTSRTSGIRGNLPFRTTESQQNAGLRMANTPVSTTESRQENHFSTDPSETQPSSCSTKSTSSAGRERLLEWLRASQAKRDENNRQIFTRWIDRLERLNRQAAPTGNSNLNAPFLPSDFPNPMDYQRGAIYQQAQPNLPGLLTASTFWLGNQLGIQGPSPLPKLAVALQTSLSPTCIPNLLGGKPALPGVLQFPFISEMPSPTSVSERIHSENSNQTFLDSIGGSSASSQRSLHCAETTSNVQMTCEKVKNTDEVDQQSSQLTSFPYQQSSYIQNVANPGLTHLNPMANGPYSQPYYIALPILNDPTYCSQMLGYYCYPNQVITAAQLGPNGSAQVEAPRTPEYGQPLIYMMHGPGNQQNYSLNQPFYAPGTCTHADVHVSDSSEPISYDPNNRRPDLPSERNITEQVNFNLSRRSEPRYTLSHSKVSPLIDGETGNDNIRCMEDQTENTNECDVLENDPTRSSFDFQMKWYSVLNDINSTAPVNDQSSLNSMQNGLQFLSENQLSATNAQEQKGY